MWQDFKKFAIKGNVMDLAVGVIIGAAFGKIVTSLVNDMIMPIVGLLLGGINLSTLQYPLGQAIFKYGAFLQSVVDFLIVSFSIFCFVQLLSRFKKKEEKVEPKAVLSKEEILLTEIRDLLRQGSKEVSKKSAGD